MAKMNRTALELTAEELQAYKPYRKYNEAQTAERWTHAWEIARTIAGLLHNSFGASRVVLFGSLTRREWFSPWSDIDIAAWGIPAAEFYRAVALVTGLTPEFEIDLIELETCHPGLQKMIEREGLEL